MIRHYLWRTSSCAFLLHARPWVRAAHPAFPAPSPNEGHDPVKARAHFAPRERYLLRHARFMTMSARVALPPARAVVYERFASGTCRSSGELTAWMVATVS
jgi:hypothetical protein